MTALNFTDAAVRAHWDAGHSQADAARHFAVSEVEIFQGDPSGRPQPITLSQTRECRISASGGSR